MNKSGVIKSVAAVAALFSLAACETMPPMTPQQGATFGRGAGQALCGGGIAILQQKGSDLARIATAAGGAYACGQMGAAYGEAKAAANGNCTQRVTYNADGSRTVTSTCQRNTGFPGSVPPPQ